MILIIAFENFNLMFYCSVIFLVKLLLKFLFIVLTNDDYYALKIYFSVIIKLPSCAYIEHQRDGSLERMQMNMKESRNEINVKMSTRGKK